MPKIPTIPGLDLGLGLGKAITEKDDNSSDIKHDYEDGSSDTSSYQSSEFDEIKELKMRVGLIAQKSLNQNRMSKDKNTSIMSSQKQSMLSMMKKTVNFNDLKCQPSGFSIGQSTKNKSKTPVRSIPQSMLQSIADPDEKISKKENNG